MHHFSMISQIFRANEEIGSNRPSAAFGGLMGGGLLKRFLVPFEDVQLNQYEGNQPEERIPEVDEISFYSPVDRRE